MTVVIGIDVGLTGGIAAIGPTTCYADDLPVMGEKAKARINAAALADMIRKLNAEHAFIEYAWPHPDQGVSSVFRYGRAAGAIEAAVACVGIPYSLIVPQVWKKFFGLKGPNKEMSRQLAIQTFASAADRLKRVKDHGRAEALLIALYGRSILQNRKAA